MSDILGVGKIVEKLTDPISYLIKKVAGPVAEEIGLTLQDSMKIYRAKRQYRLFEKMQTFVAEAGYEPRRIPLKVLLPALDYASVEEDEDLHTAWAALLANAAAPDTDSIPSAFPEILRQLSPSEAKLITAAFEYPLRWKYPKGVYQRTPDDRVVHSRYDRETLFKLWVDAGCSLSGKTFITAKESDTELGGLFERDERQFEFAMDNLIRLGIMTAENDLKIPMPDITETTGAAFTKANLQHTSERLFRISRLGVQFVHMCRRPSQRTGSSTAGEGSK